MTVEKYTLFPQDKIPVDGESARDEEEREARLEAEHLQLEDNRRWNERVADWVKDFSADIKEESADVLETKFKKFVAVGIACLMTISLGRSAYIIREHKNEKLQENAEQEKIKLDRKNSYKQYLTYALSSSPINEQSRAELQAHVEALKDKLYDGYFKDLMESDQEIQKRVNNRELPATPLIEGFDKFGVDAEDIRPLFDASLYPPGFMAGNVRAWKYTGERVRIKKIEPMMQTYPDNTIELLESSKYYLTSKNQEGEFRDVYMIAITHEGGHANDWARKVRLSPTERVQFLWETSDVFDNHRQYNTPLTSAFTPENLADTDLKLEIAKGLKRPEERILYGLTLDEWWAELCAGYLSFPLIFNATASPQEKALVKKWTERPNEQKKFEAERAWEKRQSVWKKQKDIIYKKLRAKNMDDEGGLRKFQEGR